VEPELARAIGEFAKYLTYSKLGHRYMFVKLSLPLVIQSTLFIYMSFCWTEIIDKSHFIGKSSYFHPFLVWKNLLLDQEDYFYCLSRHRLVLVCGSGLLDDIRSVSFSFVVCHFGMQREEIILILKIEFEMGS
jgi:hypothetical protein